jgi:Chaperone of endosialidase
MSYNINKTDGTVLTTVLDGTMNTTATDLTIFGKKSILYGELLNENFIYLLENFSNNTAPKHPITGQLWFDLANKQLKVYDGTRFISNQGPVVSPTKPVSSQSGNFWIDSLKQQLHFNVSDTVSVLAGPIYTAQQGTSGFEVLTVNDNTVARATHTIVLVKAGNSLLGIYSNAEFTPATPILGFNGIVIYHGFTSSDMVNIKLHATASQALALVTATGSIVQATDFLTKTGIQTIDGQLYITNPTIANPVLVMGPTGSENEFLVSNAIFKLNSTIPNQNFQIGVLNQAGSTMTDQVAVHVDTATNRIGLYNTSPAATLDVSGSVYIKENLTFSAAGGISVPTPVLGFINDTDVVNKKYVDDHSTGTASTVVLTTGIYVNPSWITSLSATKVLPSQTNNNGKVLVTDGTSLSWSTPARSLPIITVNDLNKVLTVDSTQTPIWATIIGGGSGGSTAGDGALSFTVSSASSPYLILTTTPGNTVFTANQTSNTSINLEIKASPGTTLVGNIYARDADHQLVLRDEKGDFCASNIYANLIGNAATVTNGFYTSSSYYLGTGSVSINRVSAVQLLSGISGIDLQNTTVGTTNTGTVRLVPATSIATGTNKTVIVPAIDGTLITTGDLATLPITALKAYKISGVSLGNSLNALSVASASGLSLTATTGGVAVSTYDGSASATLALPILWDSTTAAKTPGQVTHATITFDKFGRITAASSGVVSGTVANSITFADTGGAVANTSFDGSVARTIDYQTVGAPSKTGTGASGTWSISISGAAGSAATAATATTATTAGAAATVDATNASQNGDGWWRSTGGAGWYSTTYAVGIYATEVGNVRTYNGANFIAAGNVTAYSDKRLKENINVIPNALSKVQAIRGVTFTRNDMDDEDKIHTGVIAQEVLAVFPEAVMLAREDDYYTVAYGNMVGLLIEAIKEQQTQIDELKQQVSKLVTNNKE